MVTPQRDKTDGAPPRDIHIEEKDGPNWLAWLALVAGLLALLWFIGNRNDDSAEPAPVDGSEPATTIRGVVTDADIPAEVPFTSGLGTYLAGTEALPRTFTFEKLNFDTAKSDVRAVDQVEVAAIAAALKQYPNSRIRVVGYADARGGSAANNALGKARADSVKAALVASDVAASRIDTASGGETDPVETNATSTGQAENRRTELVVLQR